MITTILIMKAIKQIKIKLTFQNKTLQGIQMTLAWNLTTDLREISSSLEQLMWTQTIKD
jgi:hypothetical protein